MWTQSGELLLIRPVTQHMATMMSTVKGTDVLQAERGEVLDDPAKLEALFESALERGLEGLVVKRVDSPYQAGARNFNWVKLKKHSRGALEDTIDCVMLGYFLGRGKRAELGVGALLVGVYDKDADEFVTVTKIGTGLGDEQWRALSEPTTPLRAKEAPPARLCAVTPHGWARPHSGLSLTPPTTLNCT